VPSPPVSVRQCQPDIITSVERPEGLWRRIEGLLMKRFVVAVAVWAMGLAWALSSLASSAGSASAAVPAVTTVSTGYTHSCALNSTGGVDCWGANALGELGNGTTTRSARPVHVIGLRVGVIAVSASAGHACALTSGGAVKCWGYNVYGQLGNGTTTNSTVPVDVVGLGAGVTAVTAGPLESCAVTTVGAVKCWGFTRDGQPGNVTTKLSSVPVDVVGLGSGVVSVALGGNFSCALTSGGGVKCWGFNEVGQLGNGTSTDSSVPVDVVGLASGVVSVSAGDQHSCALTSGGAVKCWGGAPWSGQLGNGGTSSSSVPVDVIGLGSGVVSVSAGQGHTCAVTLGGAVRCWGENDYGQLGNGSVTGSGLGVGVPVDVVGLGSGAVMVAGGGRHTCAVTSDGAVKCWGENTDGELGDGTTTLSEVPVDVVFVGHTRISGADRYGTAVAISQSAFQTPNPGNPFAVTVASGTNFPDALAAGPVAAALGNPLLLVPSDGALPSTVSTELTRLNPWKVTIAGGTAAVSNLVERELTGNGALIVDRRAGQDRYETAAKLAELTGGLGRTVFIATGASFPDALGGSAAAARFSGALLLTDRSSLPQATASALTSGKPLRVIILGGETVVEPLVRTQIEALLVPGATVERWSGADRYATAATISSKTYPDGATTAYLASAASYPDALAGAPVAAKAGAPLLLTSRDCVPASTLAELVRLGATKIVVLGGTSAVSDAAADLTACTG
jgi:putative cell wall-binding protein/alpha-tubulin suppressor-like RCC1 family protein